MRNVDTEKLTSLCPDPIIGVDRWGTINVFNPAAEKLLGYSLKEVLGLMHISDIYPGKSHARQIKHLIYGDVNGEPGQLEGFETMLVRKDGSRLPIRLSASLVIVDGEEVGSIGFFHDMSQQRELQSQLEKLSITDELTGLHNQRHFYKILATELEQAHRYNRPLSLICFDLDRFKAVNDNLGHLMGDRLLKLVGEVMNADLRKVDSAFRYGGDEFMLILPETALDKAVCLAERVRLKFSASVLQIEELKDYSVTFSMGVSETHGGEGLDQVVQRADQAMYQAKQSGGNQVFSLPAPEAIQAAAPPLADCQYL
ncbi:sensor domain-containing diguanylate cyclase [Marinobacterium jannaschii]|uniref:sensor domain-containing diguanylate cyclase n=1 Tax=Marinobacterium jannaschii TaxID=64970 RepID=UPI000684D2A4|nr:sensor domain-containing diguanylate cyclase [Marinobacterium jannaschii]